MPRGAQRARLRADEAGLGVSDVSDVSDVADVLVAVAPIGGAPRAMTAVAKIAEALDLAIQRGSEDTQ